MSSNLYGRSANHSPRLQLDDFCICTLYCDGFDLVWYICNKCTVTTPFSQKKGAPFIDPAMPAFRTSSVRLAWKRKQLYAVAIGRRVGIYNSWHECKQQVTLKYPCSRWFLFRQTRDQHAQDWSRCLHSLTSYVQKGPRLQSCSVQRF